jgi:pimeloyl-ACP methyl ester carboxylesterase
VSQSPLMDGQAGVRRLAQYAGPGALVRGFVNGLRDVAGSWFGHPYRVPVVGPPGSNAAMSTPDAEPGFRGIAGPDFENAVCARMALTVPWHRPVRDAARVPCPILVQICEQDSVAPIDATDRAATLAGSKATVVRYPIGHFAIYVGPGFEASVADQIGFFRKHLDATKGA